MDAFLTIGIVGAIIPFAVEWLKRKFGDEDARFYTLLLCLVCGSIIWVLSSYPIWQTVLGCLGAASAIYSYIIKVSE